MKVRRERPSQRLHHRVSAPISVEIAGERYDALDWSLGGFGVAGFAGTAQPGDTISALVHLPFQGFDISFEVKCEVKRRSDNDTIGVAFTEVGEREQELMRHFIDNLVRGSMSVVDDTILRIDTPVTPVSTKPDPNPTEMVPTRRLPLKAMVMTGFYFTAGFLILAYAYMVLQANFVRMEIPSAVVSAPVQPILSTTDGLVKQIHAQEDDLIDHQAPLFSFTNPPLQQRIEAAKVRVNRALLTLRARTQEVAAEQAKFGDYKLITQSEIRRLDARIASLQKRAALAQAQVRRHKTLQRKGWQTKSKLDDAALRHETLLGELEDARILMHKRRALLDSLEDGRFYDGENLEGRLQDLRTAADLAADEVMLAKDELSTLIRQSQRLIIGAPDKGRIITLLKTNGATVKRGEQIALFERDEARTINAYMTQEEILEIGLGDVATVYFPSLDRTVEAMVTHIDRTHGYIDEVNSQYTWRGPKDLTAKVTMQFLDISLSDVRNAFPPGLPAMVIFQRRGTNFSVFNLKSFFKEGGQA